MRQKVPVVVLLLGSALLSQPALAQERVVGLLALPEVFGRGACDRFTPRPLELRATPQGPVVGTVLVVKPWTHHSNGGCEGLEVGVRAPLAATVQQLPTMEYAYEKPGAVVLGRRGKWLRVRLNVGSAWLEASAQDKFYVSSNSSRTVLRISLKLGVGKWPPRRARPAAQRSSLVWRRTNQCESVEHLERKKGSGSWSTS